MAPPTIGVLALQGAFAKHIEVLSRLGVEAIEVRKPQQLQACQGLILPGGESTAILKLLQDIELFEPLRKFGQQKPLFGTCAGLILMASSALPQRMHLLELLHVEVQRNGYGRQADSFSVELSLEPPINDSIRGLFIRAPRIKKVGSEVKVLAYYEGEAVLIQQGFHLGATFHPELTHSLQLHRYFLELVKGQISEPKLPMSGK